MAPLGRRPYWKWIVGVIGVLVLAVWIAVDSGSGAGGRRSGLRAMQAIDGDTLELNGQAVDLAEIDAPELGQLCLDGSRPYACGLNAAFELNKILALEEVTCTPAGEGAAGYECSTSNAPLGLRLVEDGLAVARSGGTIEVAEKKAREVPLGIWRGEFVDPEDWRSGERLPEERDARSCPVLGIDVDGVPAYLVPTDAAYVDWKDRTEGIRERFCSDEEARARGRVHLAVR